MISLPKQGSPTLPTHARLVISSVVGVSGFSVPRCQLHSLWTHKAPCSGADPRLIFRTLRLFLWDVLWNVAVSMPAGTAVSTVHVP